MRSPLILPAVLLALLVSCDDARDPITPPVVEPPINLCSYECAGLDLAIDSVRVAVPAGRTTVFSGDTVAVMVSITNRGTVASDSSVSLSVWNRSNASNGLDLPPLRAGATTVLNVPIIYPMFSRTARTRDSLYVEVSRYGNNVPFYYQFHDEKITASYSIAPTTMRVEGTPSILRFPSTQYEVRVIVNNPSPRTIPGDSLTACVFDIDHCFLNNIKPTYMPAVGPGQSVTVPYRLEIGVNNDTWTPTETRNDYELLVCHGSPRGNSNICGSQRTTIVPDFEKFCPTLPVLLPGGSVTIENRGSCGEGPIGTGQELAAIDVVAGRTYRLTVSGTSPVNPEFRQADASQFWPTVQGSNPQTHVITPSFSGRLYIFMYRGTSFTLQLAQVS